MAPLVSIVVPYYNNSSAILNTLRTISSQTYKVYEIIIVNDGSEIDERKFLYGLRSEFSLNIIDQENAGPAAARNAGIRAANGEFIALMDADDLWSGSKLELQMESILHSGAILSLTDTKTVDESGEICSINKFSIYDCELERFKWNILSNSVHSFTSTMLFRRQAALDAGLMIESLRYREDHSFLLRLLDVGRCSFVNEVQSTRVIHRESYSFATNSDYTRRKLYWDLKFLDSVKDLIDHSVYLKIKFLYFEQAAKFDILLGMPVAAISKMTTSIITGRGFYRPIRIIVAAVLSMVRPGLFDAMNPAVAEIRKRKLADSWKSISNDVDA